MIIIIKGIIPQVQFNYISITVKPKEGASACLEVCPKCDSSALCYKITYTDNRQPTDYVCDGTDEGPGTQTLVDIVILM